MLCWVFAWFQSGDIIDAQLCVKNAGEGLEYLVDRQCYRGLESGRLYTEAELGVF